MSSHVDEHVAFPTRCEYPNVLEEDRELDKENHKTVNGGRYIDPLKTSLKSASTLFPFVRSHIEHSEERS